MKNMFGKYMYLTQCVSVFQLTKPYLDTSFHWIFSESHHGKGEHDGHGATDKIAIKFYVLGGKAKLQYN